MTSTSTPHSVEVQTRLSDLRTDSQWLLPYRRGIQSGTRLCHSVSGSPPVPPILIELSSSAFSSSGSGLGGGSDPVIRPAYGFAVTVFSQVLGLSLESGFPPKLPLVSQRVFIESSHFLVFACSPLSERFPRCFLLLQRYHYSAGRTDGAAALGRLAVGVVESFCFVLVFLMGRVPKEWIRIDWKILS
ncbi:hypothetical protein K402DRAFT_268930 [Aulographum hederae CBS 113979]|uniref:Uncharacterized protein n=1 Tax=Aulographum hederae CBS 113979 TaxID=1176131 RepID=A0A6G1H7U1_9PEZI|nr:hypothetical protein K402DRAFT_268930 [Aulographum hederae CBS 113979]